MSVIYDPSLPPGTPSIQTNIAGATTMNRGAFRARATGWMRTHMGAAGNKLSNWGLAGVRSSFTEGAMSGLGFYKVPNAIPYGGGPVQPAKYKFLGGVSKRGMIGLGVGAGVGSMVYAATDNPLLGVGAGVGATWAAKSTIRGAGGAGLKLAGPLFIGAGMVSGYKEEGLWGAAKGLGFGVAEWGLWNVGFKAAGTAFKGSAVGGAMKGLMRAGPAVAVIAAALYGMYKAGEYFSERGRESVKSEFAGDTSAFTTGAAYSMRQRAMQEISRSHTNSRTILGNEASLMHLR